MQIYRSLTANGTNYNTQVWHTWQPPFAVKEAQIADKFCISPC